MYSLRQAIWDALQRTIQAHSQIFLFDLQVDAPEVRCFVLLVSLLTMLIVELVLLGNITAWLSQQLLPGVLLPRRKVLLQTAPRHHVRVLMTTL